MSETGIVFAIDDDAASCDFIRRTLEGAGLTVYTYASADSFSSVDMRQVAGDGPCCTLLDLELPGGMDFLERRYTNGTPCPVIAVTSNGSVQSAVRSMKLGAVDVWQKPLGAESLVEGVREALRRSAVSCSKWRERQTVRSRLAILSPREREMLHAIVQGKSTKMVADLLGISARTVDHHRANLMDKMGATNVADLVRMAVEADYRTVEATGTNS